MLACNIDATFLRKLAVYNEMSSAIALNVNNYKFKNDHRNKCKEKIFFKPEAKRESTQGKNRTARMIALSSAELSIDLSVCQL